MLLESRPIIYITPLLEEAYTVVGAIVDDNGRHMRDDSGYYMYDQDNLLYTKSFMLPNNNNNNGSKIDSIKSLIQNSRCIASTHQLFSMLDQEIIDMIKERNYVLVVDECLSVWSNLNIYEYFDADDIKAKKQTENEKQEQESTGNTKTDKEILCLIENGVIEVDPVGLLHWQDDKFKVSKGLFFDKVKRLCDMKQLYLSNGKVVFWELNSVVLKAFSKIIIGTYMFEYSFMSHYLNVHGFEYKVEKFGKTPNFYKQFITVQQGKINDIGEKDFTLSYSNLCIKKHTNGHPKDVLRKNVDNFLKNRCASKKGERIWTCFKKVTPTIANRTYTQDWVAYNVKATNKYRDVRCVAYLCNNFPNTFLVSMVSKRNNRKFDADMWALSEMLQYIYRTRIRGSRDDGHIRDIDVYIPSKRMRDLFEWWLEQDSLDFKAKGETSE